MQGWPCNQTGPTNPLHAASSAHSAHSSWSGTALHAALCGAHAEWVLHLVSAPASWEPGRKKPSILDSWQPWEEAMVPGFFPQFCSSSSTTTFAQVLSSQVGESYAAGPQKHHSLFLQQHPSAWVKAAVLEPQVHYRNKLGTTASTHGGRQAPKWEQWCFFPKSTMGISPVRWVLGCHSSNAPHHSHRVRAKPVGWVSLLCRLDLAHRQYVWHPCSSMLLVKNTQNIGFVLPQNEKIP